MADKKTAEDFKMPEPTKSEVNKMPDTGKTVEEEKAAREAIEKDQLTKTMELKDSQATKEQKIKDILKNRGMDSQQREQAFSEIKEVLGDKWETLNLVDAVAKQTVVVGTTIQ